MATTNEEMAHDLPTIEAMNVALGIHNHNTSSQPPLDITSQAPVENDAAHQEPNRPSAATVDTPQQEPLLPTVDQTPVNTHPVPTLHNTRKELLMSSSWWWWEIGGAVVALASLFTTIAVLAVLDNNPIDSWNRNIQPSALLSTLSTVGKMGLALVVASCVSQLKWSHFQTPNSLSHLDVFDEVSRAGPWGVAKMFIKTRRHLLKKGPNFMIALLGLITLGAFAIDPMIQQILDSPLRETALHNVTASMMSNRRYTSFAVDDRNTFDDENNALANGTRLLALETNFLNQLTSTTYLPRVECPFPGTRCEFNDITMLGLCSNFSDVTDITTHECQQHASGLRDPAHYLTCTFAIQNVATYRNLTLNFGAGDVGTDVGYVYDNFRSILENLELLGDPPVVHQPADVARLFTIKVVGTVNGTDFLDDLSLGIPDTRVTMTSWSWCQQNYSSVSFDGHGGSISEASGFKTAPLLFAPRSGVLPNEYIFASNEESAPFYEGSSLQEVQGSYSTNFFRVNMHSLFGLLDTKWPQYLDPSIKATLHPQVSVGSNYVNNGDYVLDAIGMASFMVNANISQLVNNVATAVTNQVQLSAYNSNNNMTQGTVYAVVPYYHVRWGWLVLPLLEAVAAALMLCITIWLNNLPLLKSSNIGLLAHGPEDAVSYRVRGLETANKWVKFGDETTVMLLEDEKGWTRLTPA